MTLFKHYKHAYLLLDSKVRWLLALTAGLLSVVALLDLIGLGLIFPIAKLLGGNKDFLMLEEFSLIRPFVDDIDPVVLAGWLSVILVLLLVVKGIIAVSITYYTTKKLMQAEARYLARLYKSYLSAPIKFHLEHNSAEFIRNLNQNVVSLFRNTAIPLAQTFSELLLATGIIAVLIYANPFAAFISLFVLTAGGVIYSLAISSPVSKMAKESHALNMDVLKVMNESLGSISEIKVFDKEGFFLNAFMQTRMKLAKISWINNSIMSSPRFILESLVGIMIMSIILLSISSQQNGEEVMVVLILYAVAAMRLMPIVTRMVATANEARIAIPYVDQLNKDVEMFGRKIVIDNPWHIYEDREPVPGQLPGFYRELELKHISHHYGDDVAALDNVSCTILRGQSIGVVGHSGAGKTTLAGVILGLIHPSRGEILVDGEHMDVDEPAIHRSIGYVPQNIFMLDDTIRSNVAFGVPSDKINDDCVLDALKKSDLEDFVKSLPDGIYTRVGERGALVSGGQRQRIGIARALYYDPAILLLDEATSALDVETESRISGVIQKLHGDKTLIIIAHRLSTIQNCDKVLFMKDGRIEASGTFSDLNKTNDEFCRLIERARLNIHNSSQELEGEII